MQDSWVLTPFFFVRLLSSRFLRNIKFQINKINECYFNMQFFRDYEWDNQWIPCSVPALLNSLHCSFAYNRSKALATTGAATDAAIVYLAHNENLNTNWVAICQHFNDDSCQRVSGAEVASFIAALIFMFLVVLSVVTLRKN